MERSIAVARAIFTGALLRSESTAPDISREDATVFARTLLKTCNICTTSNMKLCNSFTVKNILPSQLRTAALGKYLLTLCKSLAPRDGETSIDTSKPGDENEGLGNVVNGKLQQPPEPAFKRLHILYILHDVICYAHMHPSVAGAVDKLKIQLGTIAELTACGCTGKAARTSPAILELITYWKAVGVLDESQLDQIRSDIGEAEKTSWEAFLSKLAAREDDLAQEETRLKDDESKWIIPERHGVPNDPTAPWHELPAANGLYLKRVYGYPLRASAMPPGGLALSNAGIEADESLKREVTGLYNDVLHCFDKYTHIDEVQDVDALGNIIWKDPERPTRNYWGFALDGIDRRKELARRFAENAPGYGAFGESESKMSDARERAFALTAERGRGMGRGNGFGGGRAGWRGRGRVRW